MAAESATLEPALVHALSAADPDHRRWLNRTTGIAIGVSVAAHVALGLYIYEAKYGAPPAVVAADPPLTTFTPNVVIKHPPKPVRPPPHQLFVRTPHATAPPTAPPAPFTPTPLKPVVDPAPPRIADNVVPYTPPVIADPAPPSVITSPDWLSRPGPNEFSRFYPQPALEQNASGMAVLACTVSANGSVKACQVATETPKGLGFGDAAKKLAPYFKMRPQLKDGTPVDGASIRIPIRFNLA